MGRRVAIAAACALAAGFAGTSLGQVDLTGDGIMEIALPNEIENEFVVLDGATGDELWRKYGESLFGWAATAHPDVDGDGLRDVIVTAPGAGVADTPGSVQALRGFDGQVLWTCEYGATEAKFGLGVGVIPDQNRDSYEDILVAMLSDDPAGERAVLLDGQTGEVLATAAGPVAPIIDATRRGTFQFRTTDIDDSGAC